MTVAGFAPGDLDDETWAAMTPREREETYRLLHDISGGETLREFVARMSPHHPVPRHLDPIVAELELARHEPVKVAISMPPGHAKTSLFLHAFPWWMLKHPADTNCYFTYNKGLAFSKSAAAREIARRAGVSVNPAIDGKGEWRTPEGGGLIAGGIKGGGTGYRGQGLFVIDDPYRNQIDASSKAYRDMVDDWLKAVATTRLESASVFLVHTRWHSDDEIGRVMKRRGWRLYNLPALAEEGDILGRAPGEALWPDLFPVEKLVGIRDDDVGEYVFAAMYQGRPRPKGGSVFGEPTYYDPDTLDLTGARFVLALDPAASTSTSSDYSAAVVLAIKPRAPTPAEAALILEGKFDKSRLEQAYVLRVYRKQVAIPVLVADMVELQAEFGNTRINVEAVGGFKAVPQMLRSIDARLRIKEIHPTADKFTRAQKCAAAWNAGRVLVPGPSASGQTPRWLSPYLDEITTFTGVDDKTNDQVDATVHAFNESTMGGNRGSPWTI